MKEFNYETIDEGYYDKVYTKSKGIQSKWHHLKFKGVRNVLDTLEYESLLDVACGPGTFISTLSSENGKNIFGLDVSPKQLEYAKNRYGRQDRQFVQSSGWVLPFDNDSLDVVVCLEFIEHITMEDNEKLLAEVQRCLKKGGTFITTTPNYRSLWPFLEWCVSRLSPIDYRDQHITHFTAGRLKQLLEAQGFEIMEVRQFLLVAPFFAALNWNLADRIFDGEYRRLKNCGHSLLAVARKN